MAVKVLLDIARPRVTRTPLTVRSDGRSWDLANSSNVLLDPVTLSVFLLPQVLDPTWATSSAGVYARLTRTSYEKQDGTALPTNEWSENNYRFNGDVRLESRGVNYPVFTATDWPVNQPFFLSFYTEQGSHQGDVALEFGWGEIGATDTVSLRVFGSGRCQLYKGTEQVGDYTISGASVEVQRVAGQAQTAGQGGGIASGVTPAGGDAIGKIVNLYCIPHRRRELLVFSSAGGGFSHAFEDLDPDIVNAITVTGRFWWKVAQGKASVQAAPIRYATSGYVVGPAYLLREPPGAGEPAGFLIADDQQVSGDTTDAVPSLASGANPASPFVADGVNDLARIRVDLTGDGNTTRAVYAVDANFDPLTEDTDDGQQEDITDFVRRIEFSVPEDPSGVRGEFELRGPDDMDAAGIDRIDSQSSRPFRIEVSPEGDGADFHPFITGYTGEPRRTEMPVVGASDRARPVNIPWRDLWQQLDDLLYEDEPEALDGLNFEDAVELQLYAAGIPGAEWDVEATAFDLPFNTAVSRGEWSYAIAEGSRAGDALRKLIRDFASTWYAGFSPVDTGTVASGVRFRLHSAATLGTASKASLYLDGLPGSPPVNAFDGRRFSQRVLPPEATRIAVEGYDPRLRQRINARDIELTLENPALPPSLRPDGWVGTVRPLLVRDQVSLTTADAVALLLSQLMERLAAPETVAEWTSSLLLDINGIPLWRGDVVNVVGKGRYRIESFSGTLENEADGFVFRRVNYVGRRIADEE